MSPGAVTRRLVALATLAACSKSSAPSAGLLSASDGVPLVLAPMDSVEADAWARATDGGEDERIRLYGLVGCAGLRERAERPAQRLTALRAMRYCDDFSELPWLVAVATSGQDEEPFEAIEAIVDLAARPRRATDPEDGQELFAGCQALLALSRSAGQPRPRRVMAVRALRMLSERGCVKRGEIPVDLDARD